MKLLIVDDEPIIVRGLSTLLDYADFGYQHLYCATNSTDALQILRAQQPEVMLCDIAMPNMTGLDLLRIIRDEKLPTQVILLSGYRNFDYAQEAVTLGAKGYLLKPIDADKLAESLNTLRTEHQQRTEHAALAQRIRHLTQSKPAQTAQLPPLPLNNQPFCLACFHLSISESLGTLSSGLLHFSALSKAEAFFSAENCSAFQRNDFLCVIIFATEEESCTSRAQRLCEACSLKIEQALSHPFNFVLCDPLTDTQQIPKAFHACASRLSQPHTPIKTEENLIDRMKEYIAHHYGEDLTLEHMGETFSMNASYFSSFFHQKTGVRYKDYLTRIRMTEAKRLLMQTDLMVYEISQQVGFSDIRYFSQVFTKFTGVRPKDYRRKKGKE